MPVLRPHDIFRVLAAHHVKYVIRSKEAANREKDRLALPTLRLLLQKMREGKPPTR